MSLDKRFDIITETLQEKRSDTDKQIIPMWFFLKLAPQEVQYLDSVRAEFCLRHLLGSGQQIKPEDRAHLLALYNTIPNRETV